MARYTHSEVFVRDGYDMNKRRVYIGDDHIDVDSGVIVRAITAMSNDSNAPITVYIKCHGGFVSEGLAVYDAITTADCHVTGVVYGMAGSMGSVVFQGCDTRIMGPNAVQLIHYGTFATETANVKDVVRSVEYQERLNVWMEDLYLRRIHAQHPSYSITQLRKMLVTDTYLSAEDSLRLGLTDNVLPCG